ncbi:hypothetical protein FGG08_000625 [Glutinoglossum americanum]|uniref:Protein kinase domain-containing protein n=1 Tax=Glutinoglossum americanum TaxID=1670608 RepID=A0A9P8I3K6_9PEZI|nr:hypothetical protein FGG08_000625 [Glutinoglossum americanum]
MEGQILITHTLMCSQGMRSGDTEHVAIKVQSSTHEYGVYKDLDGLPGFPLPLGFSSSESLGDCLILQLTGPPITNIWNILPKPFSLKTVLLLSVQLITRLEVLHRRGIVHCNIQPDHVTATHIQGDSVFLISFSHAKYYRRQDGGILDETLDVISNDDGGTGKHRVLRTQTVYLTSGAEKPSLEALLQGTSIENRVTTSDLYASINAGKCKTPCTVHTQATYLKFETEQYPCDDLESLAYLLLYFFRGCLPWEGLSKDDIATKKQNLLQELPDWPKLVEYLSYIHGLEPHEVPNYNYLRSIFARQFTEAGIIDDNSYDWTVWRLGREWQRHVREFCDGITKAEEHTVAEGYRAECLSQLLERYYDFLTRVNYYTLAGLRNDEEFLATIEDNIQKLGHWIRLILEIPGIPLIICRAHEYTSTFTKLWPEFGDILDAYRQSIAKVVKQRRENQKIDTIYKLTLQPLISGLPGLDPGNGSS